MGAGDDTISFTSDTNLDGITGADMASLFSDVEELDFTDTDLTGSNVFEIGNDDIDAMTDEDNVLSISVDLSTIALTDISVLAQSGATIDTDNTVGNTRTIDWDNGTQLIINGS